MDKKREENKDIADKIYWLLINEGQSYLCSIPLGQRIFFTPEDVRTIIKKHKDEFRK
jgi:hypothetical protein